MPFGLGPCSIWRTPTQPRRQGRWRARAPYGRIDKLLGDRKWLAGEGPSVADAYLAGTARWGRELCYFDLQHDFPRLHRHLEKLEQDPAVRFAHAIEDRLPARAAGSSGER